ncbi:MAG TPA: immunoglobulin domain-containing protein, partial [Bacteroidales bacterium]|nr:immunoglobulin domain-containing protein [Bacteroidales bacterium]
MPFKRSALLSIILLILTVPDLFSQAATITGWRHSDLVYCSAEGGDSLVGASPQNKPFYFDGVPYVVSPVLVRTADGRAIFYPNRTTVGTHTIKYGDIGSNNVTVIVTIQPPTVVTLSPFGNVCSTSPSFSLFNSDSSNVSPKNGCFSGPGVNGSGNFNPATAGPGVHTITYTAGVGSCLSSVSRPITVVAAPATGINPFPPVCEDTPPFMLTQGFPAGGTYSGPGVDVSGRFDQSSTGIGSFPITYTYTNGTCTNSATRNIIVSQRPTVSYSGLGSQYCTDDAGVNLTGNPASVTGLFTGPGITDNGNGTALFEPVMAGLGTHQISYIYTSPEGCADTAISQVQVGTNVIINGLAAQSCINSPDITISATPIGGTYTVTSGLTDNGDGTAVFSPSAAGPGMHTVSYTFTDANGCINTRSVQTRVYALPVPSIQNLAAAYCANNPSLTIRGNYQPSGTFSGPGITDNGNGTAVFNPSFLVPGNSYPVTYNYTDGFSGCSASVTNNVLINHLPSSTLTGNADICHGNAANLSITLAGSGPFTISLSDGTGTYTYNNVAGPVYNTQVFPADTVTYTLSGVADIHGCNSAGNGVAVINVLPEVAILSQPVSQHVCPGKDVSFSVTASGVNLNYQWEKNGVPVAGATNASIILNDVQPADIGAYRCTISGDCGIAVTSNDALLQLWSPVQLLTHPADVYECEGGNAILQVQASGSNLTYQWYRNNIAVNDAPGYSGTSTFDLNIGPLITAMEGNYHVTVTGSCGIVNSNPAIVKIDRNINITNQPQNANVCEGINAVFSVSALGDNLSYQ